MNKAYFDWPALLVILVLLGWTAYQFSRRTYRITVLVAVMAGALALTEYGAASGATNFIDAFKAGSNVVTQTMLNPLVAGTQSFLPGVVGWVALLVLCAGVLVWFDTWSARREQPRVTVAEAPPAETGRPGLTNRRIITEELRFRLPAVYVRKPATMPGGLTLDNLASMVSESEVKGGKLTAALMRVVHALEGQPRTYEAHLFVECCTPDGQVCSDGSLRRVTVDLQDARTGRSIAVQMLPPCSQREAAEQAAGFAARQVFRDDPSTPAWAVGSRDGQDLSAYLLSQEICRKGRTAEDLHDSRRRRREELEQVVKNSPAPGVVGYELAAMYDMDGEYLNSLLLHLRNRVHYPRFWAGRQRLATALSALAGADFDQQRQGRVNAGDGAAPGELARVRAEIAWRLDQAGLLRELNQDEGAKESLQGNPWTHAPDAVSKALLYLAEQEFRACRRAEGTFSILWNAFAHREERASLLQMLRGNRRRLYPWRRQLASSIAIKIATQRLNLLQHYAEADELFNKALARAMAAHEAAADEPLQTAQTRAEALRTEADDSLEKAQQWAKDRLGVDEDQAVLAERVPWPAVYNAACLFALSSPGHQPTHNNVATAVKLLRLAIDDPACDLEYPSEWIAMDPDLRSLRDQPAFDEFVREQAAKDFAPSQPAEVGDNVKVGDKWFRERLPVAEPGDTDQAHPRPA